MQDFTLTTYKILLQEMFIRGYSSQTLQDFIQQPNKKIVILRHDVDRLPENALVIAKIEKEAGIKASYYFRIVKASYDEDIIRQIADLGHEIGYHYENLSEISKKNPQITQIDADYLISHRLTPVPSAGATPEEWTSYSTGQAGQARINTVGNNSAFNSEVDMNIMSRYDKGNFLGGICHVSNGSN